MCNLNYGLSFPRLIEIYGCIKTILQVVFIF